MKPSSLLSLVTALVLAATVPIASAETTPEAAAAQAGVDAGADAAQSATDEKGAALLEQRNEALQAEKAAREAEPIRELAADELPWLRPSVGAGPQE